MKNYKKSLILSLVAFSIISFSAQAQASLNNQYQQLKAQSNNYQDYKVIKQTALDALWTRVQDSTNVTKRQLVEARKEIDAQKAQLTQLQQQLNTKGNQLQQQLKAKEDQLQQNDQAAQQVPVFGINVDKTGYVTFSYIMYAVLLGVLAFFFIRYQSSNRITVSTRRDYEENKKQVDDYKKKLLETQTSLGRELQTERNRVDELVQEVTKLRNQQATR